MIKGFSLFSLPSYYHSIITKRAAYEESVLKVMTMLPGKYRYEQVEAAIQAAGVSPSYMHESLAANVPTPVLLRFYEALHGPGWNAR